MTITKVVVAALIAGILAPSPFYAGLVFVLLVILSKERTEREDSDS